MKHSYDVTNVVAEFLSNHYGRTRADLVAEMTEALNQNIGPIHQLMAEVGHEAIAQSYSPVQLIRLGVMYGSVIGILLEKDRVTRERRYA